jgi:hypothetical protein
MLEKIIVRGHLVLQNKNKKKGKKENHFAAVGMALCSLLIFSNSGRHMPHAGKVRSYFENSRKFKYISYT